MRGHYESGLQLGTGEGRERERLQAQTEGGGAGWSEGGGESDSDVGSWMFDSGSDTIPYTSRGEDEGVEAEGDDEGPGVGSGGERSEEEGDKQSSGEGSGGGGNEGEGVGPNSGEGSGGERSEGDGGGVGIPRIRRRRRIPSRMRNNARSFNLLFDNFMDEDKVSYSKNYRRGGRGQGGARGVGSRSGRVEEGVCEPERASSDSDVEIIMYVEREPKGGVGNDSSSNSDSYSSPEIGKGKGGGGRLRF